MIVLNQKWSDSGKRATTRILKVVTRRNKQLSHDLLAPYFTVLNGSLDFIGQSYYFGFFNN